MSYNFPPEIKSLVDQNMALGMYPTEDHLLQAALHVLSDYHATVADVRQGVADFEHGHFQDISETFGEIRTQLGKTL
jgi:hypothetical protein